MEEGFSELSKAFRMVTKIVREKAEDYFGNSTPLYRALREVADLETNVVANSLLRDIANASYDCSAYYAIMQNVWEGIQGGSDSQKRVYKSLCLLEALLLFGPPRVHLECRDSLPRIRLLTGFYARGPTGDLGGGVRQKATDICELIEDEDKLKKAKEKAAKEAAKYMGIENPNPPMASFGRFGRPPPFSGPDMTNPYMLKPPDNRLAGQFLGTNLSG